jgi:hypothetical protein
MLDPLNRRPSRRAGGKVEISFQLVRKSDLPELAWRTLHEHDAEAGETIHALSLMVQTMMAPFGDVHHCCCCGTEFPKKKKAEAFVVGSSCEGQFLQPVCAQCARLDEADILQLFAQSFQAEYPTSERLTAKGWI